MSSSRRERERVCVSGGSHISPSSRSSVICPSSLSPKSSLRCSPSSLSLPLSISPRSAPSSSRISTSPSSPSSPAPATPGTNGFAFGSNDPARGVLFASPVSIEPGAGGGPPPPGGPEPPAPPPPPPPASSSSSSALRRSCSAFSSLCSPSRPRSPCVSQPRLSHVSGGRQKAKEVRA